MKTLMMILLMLSAASAHAVDRFQVQTTESDVNMWWNAGRAHSHTIGRIKAGETLTVLREKTLENGQTWYRVRAEIVRGVRTEQAWGWVHSKFFKRVRGGRNAETAADFCVGCSAREKARRAAQLGKLPTAAPSAVSKSGFRWPVGGVIRSPFGWRIHPFTKVRTFHNGIDIAGNAGKPVAAAKAGVVVHSNSNCRVGNYGCGGRAGNMVVIDHGDGTKTQYMHLSSSCRLPAEGARVAQGAIIGCVGSTGMSTGPHLHFGVYIGKKQYLDPMSVLPRR